MRTLGYILLSSILLISSLEATAQGKKENKAEKEPISYSFRSIAVSGDLFGLAYSLIDDYASSEIAIEANFGNRLYPIAEIGYGWCDATDETNGIRYKTNAPYYRVGLNYNFSTTRENPAPDYCIFGIGRIGWTSCKYDVDTPPITDPVWGGSTSLHLSGVKGNAAWAEVGVGIRMKVTKNFHMGWSIRYKARLSQEKAQNSEMWYIPGYGTNKSTGFGGTYNLIYEIPFK